MAEAQKRQPQENLRAIAALIASILVPIAVAFVGSYYTNVMKESENRIKYVELAVAILRSEPRPEATALRGWAVEVLAKQSVVPLSAEVQKELKANSVPYAGGWDTGTTYDYTYSPYTSPKKPVK
jgi:hypothetical protein